MFNKYVNTLVVTALALSAGVVAHSQTVSSKITLPNLPEKIAVDQVADRIYVAVPNFGAKPYDDLVVISGITNKIIGTYHIPPYAYAIAVDAVAGKVYIAGTDEDGNSKLVEWCISDKAVMRVIPITTTPGDGLVGVAADLITHRVYVSNASDNEIDVIHNGQDVVSARIPLSAEPFGVTVNPYTSQVYVALLNGGVSVINALTNTTTTTTEVPGNPANSGIAVDILTGNVYTANATYTDNSSVAVLNGAGTVTGSITVGNTPISLDIDPFTGLLFVANSQDGTVDAIATSTNTIQKQLPVSGLFVAVSYIGQKVYVGANDGTPTLTVISEQ
jgi:YVTN family beta-propeller protein